jgi:hypothetical protein
MSFYHCFPDKINISECSNILLKMVCVTFWCPITWEKSFFLNKTKLLLTGFPSWSMISGVWDQRADLSIPNSSLYYIQYNVGLHKTSINFCIVLKWVQFYDHFR